MSPTHQWYSLRLDVVLVVQLGEEEHEEAEDKVEKSEVWYASRPDLSVLSSHV